MITKILQRLPNDCGVASLAMLLNVSYEDARHAYNKAGLGIQRKRKPPYSSNFAELRKAAELLGYSTKMTRFNGWDQIADIAILKVMVQANKNWHWVVAKRSDRGIVIYDPGVDLLSYEYPPMNIDYINFSIYKPEGNMIILVK